MVLKILEAALLVTVCITHVFADPSINDTISKLFTSIQSLQQDVDSPYKRPFEWETQKGMYQNDIRANFHGSEKEFLARDLLRIPDNNMFVTLWVTSCIVEAYHYGKAPKPPDLQVKFALDLIDKYRNHNAPRDNSEIQFWKPVYNKTANYYQSSPTNLFGVMDVPADEMKVLDDILEALHLYGIEKMIDDFWKRRGTYFAAFKIPPDFDDTFVNIGLGSLLVRDGRFPAAVAQWKQQNTNLTSVFVKLKRYAYRPFSTDQRINTIDPRSYFYLFDFIEQSRIARRDLALVTTWLQDTDAVRQEFDKGVAMPFNINNIDVTVSANVVFGITMVALSGLVEHPEALIDVDVEQIYLNTTSLIAYEIFNNFTSRPDLALTYYPSKHEFYWFVTRTYSALNSLYNGRDNPITDPRLDKMLKTAYNILRPVLRTAMSHDLLKTAKEDHDGTMYFDNFLGNDDIDLLNQTKNRGEDRIFTTAASMSALMNTWTLWKDGELIWEQDTPANITQLVEKGCQWLNINTFSGTYKPWNTFFSGSGKSIKSLPFFYPANRLEYFNGTHFKDDKFPKGLKNIIGFQGHVTPAEYAAMLKLPHFGMKTPMTFDGYNSDPDFFPFWSSDAFTYGMTLVTLSQFEKLESRVNKSLQ